MKKIITLCLSAVLILSCQPILVTTPSSTKNLNSSNLSPSKKNFGIKSSSPGSQIKKFLMPETTFKRENGEPETQIIEFEVTNDDFVRTIILNVSITPNTTEKVNNLR